MKATLTKKSRSKPLVVKISGDWEQAMAVAVNKPKPKEGWPTQGSPSKKPAVKARKASKS